MRRSAQAIAVLACLGLLSCDSILGIRAGAPRSDAIDASADGSTPDAGSPDGALGDGAPDSSPPMPEVIARNVTGIALESVGSFLYWSSSSALWRMPKAGGAPIPLVASIGTTPQGIAVDNSNIYWQDYFAKTITRAPLTGGTPVVIAAISEAPQWLALDATTVYFPTDGSPTSVMSVAKTGGTVTTLASGGDPNYVAVDATHVYWAAGDGVHRILKAGGTPQTLSSLASANGIAVDGTDAFFASPGTSQIVKVPIGGGQAVVLASTGTQPSVNAIDASHVYWTEYAVGGTVARVPKAGGLPEILATGQDRPYAVQVDASFAYWINTGDQTIMRIALP